MNGPATNSAADSSSLHGILLRQRRAWRAGEGVLVEDWLRDHPWIRNDAEGMLDLIYGEYLERQRLGQHPDVDEYRARFPTCADSLARQIELHRALESGTAALGSDPGLGSDSLPAPAPYPSSGPPHIDGYEILGEVGRGGMGVVYRARQIALGREVAIKMLRFAGLADATSHRLFRREAATIARLRHPNFVQIHDFGFWGDGPYLILEYVDGGNLSRRIGGVPQPVAWSAAQVETLASAMAYAHAAQVIHRDLKPANVLLTAQGTLKISDFGLAKELATHVDTAAGAVAATQTESVFGTPGYMPPEILTGPRRPATPAIDIYGLGAILYELLTGRAPFVGGNLWEICQQIREQDPLPIHRIRRGIPLDLETICLKCLHKEPEHRYASAAALAEDLRRFRMGETILARPVGFLTRSLRWCRRHPLVASLWAALISSLWIGLVLVTGLWLRADRLKVAAMENLRASRENLRLATDAVDAFFSKVSDDPRLAAYDLRALRRELLRTAVDFDQTFVAKADDKTESKLELARAFARLGRVTAEIDTAAEASTYLSQATSLLESLDAQPDPPAEVVLDLVRTRIALARIHDRLGDSASADSALRQALERLRGVPATTASVDRDFLLLQAQHALGRVSFRAKQGTEAEPFLMAAVEIGKRLRASHPNAPEIAFELAECLGSMGNFLRARQIERISEAESAFQQAAAIFTDLIAQAPAVSEYPSRLAGINVQLGELRAIRKSWDEASVKFQEATDLLAKVVTAHPSVLEYRADLARAKGCLANTLTIQKRFEEAERHYREVLDAWVGLAQEDPTNLDFQVQVQQARLNVATTLIPRGELQEAEPLLQEAVDRLDSLRLEHPERGLLRSTLSSAHINLAMIQSTQGRFAAAVKSWEAAVEFGPGFLANHYRGELALARLRAGDVARGLQEAAEVESTIPPGSVGGSRHTLLILARVQALAATTAQSDMSMSLADPMRDMAARGEHALRLLTRAVDAGFDEPQVLADDPILARLGEHPDYSDRFHAQLDRAVEAAAKSALATADGPMRRPETKPATSDRKNE